MPAFDNTEKMNFLELQKARVLASVSGKAAKLNDVKRALNVTKQRSAKIAGSYELKEESGVAWV